MRLPAIPTVLIALILAAQAAVSSAADILRAPAALPGTTVEMNDPEFWIRRIPEPDRVIMTPAMIREFNAKNAARKIPSDHPYAENIAQIEKDGPAFNLMDPLAIATPFDGRIVRDRLEENDRRLAKTTLYDSWELPFTDAKKDEIRAVVNLESLPAALKPRTGIVVRHASVRLWPVSEHGYLMKGYLDDINVTSVDIGMPVAVLHVSKNGDYLFVMTPVAWGWLPAVDIAFASVAKVRAFRDAPKCIVSSAHRIPLYADTGCAVHAGYLYMGERLPMTGKTAQGYRVQVPVRDFSGSLAFGAGFIKAGMGVSEGFLPYTQKNVIATVFRLLGRPYGWHDSWDERDCGGIMRVVFNCFGIALPRYWSFEQLSTDHAVFVGDIKDMAKKAEMLAAMPAGITFTGTTGHIGLYLGSVDGKPYVIHQCGWNYKDGGAEYKMARVVVSDYEHVGFNMDGIKFFAPMLP